MPGNVPQCRISEVNSAKIQWLCWKARLSWQQLPAALWWQHKWFEEAAGLRYMYISGDKCACWDNRGNQSEEATSMWIETWRTAFSVLLNRFSEQYASFSQRYMTSGKCVNEHFLITHTHTHVHTHMHAHTHARACTRTHMRAHAHTHTHTRVHTHTTENTTLCAVCTYCAQGNHYLHKLHAVMTIK